MPLSINEAVNAGVERLRLDRWANKDDHIKITIVRNPETGERCIGVWYELWSPINERVNGKNPLQNLIFGELGLGDLNAAVWTIYAPPDKAL